VVTWARVPAHHKAVAVGFVGPIFRKVMLGATLAHENPPFTTVDLWNFPEISRSPATTVNTSI